jgi:membrane-bound metal-dependent hydrolase YbcI (DUF457 family)
MIGATHMAIGLAVGSALTIGQPLTVQIGAALVGALAARLPDQLEVWGIPHRTATHSLLIPLALGWIANQHLSGLELLAAYVACWSYASHILADCLTVQGVPLLWPIPLRVRGWIVTNTAGDRAVMVLALLAMSWYWFES